MSSKRNSTSTIIAENVNTEKPTSKKVMLLSLFHQKMRRNRRKKNFCIASFRSDMRDSALVGNTFAVPHLPTKRLFESCRGKMWMYENWWTNGRILFSRVQKLISYRKRKKFDETLRTYGKNHLYGLVCAAEHTP